MKLKQIVSGGQDGADITGLEEAFKRGIPTGGFCPKGGRTESGLNPELMSKYGLVETSTIDYAPRTRLNASVSNITVWFGNTTSPGFRCTQRACRDYAKTLIKNPTPVQFKRICETNRVVNIAGNRSQNNPNVVGHVRAAFAALDTYTMSED